MSYNLIANVNNVSAWSEDIQYGLPLPLINAGIPSLALSTLVTFNGNTYYNNGTYVPNSNIDPESDPAWSLYDLAVSGGSSGIQTLESPNDTIAISGSSTAKLLDIDAFNVADGSSIVQSPINSWQLMAKPLNMYSGVLTATQDVDSPNTMIGGFSQLYLRYSSVTPPYTPITFNNTTKLFTVGAGNYIITAGASANNWGDDGSVELRIVDGALDPLNQSNPSIILFNPTTTTTTSISTIQIMATLGSNATFGLATGGVNTTCTLLPDVTWINIQQIV